jgi:steroid 5-alpha reductase family enzyme
MNPFLLSAICIFSFMCFMFLLAQFLKNNSIVDAVWGIGFILVTVATLINLPAIHKHHQLVLYLVVLWGLRLSTYILIRNWGKPEDFRYANWRKEWGNKVAVRSFFQVFMLQSVVMFINTLPVVVVNSSESIEKSLEFLYGIGTVIWLTGFYFEAAGDWEMYMFKSNPHPHKKKVLDRGLWKYTRHPNYFGEALMWWGIFLLAVPSGLWFVSVLAPVTITFLLMKVSGVTMLEKKYEGNSEYELYKKRTNAFFPWFPKKTSST